MSNSDRLASHFFNEKTLVGYMRHKTEKDTMTFPNLMKYM
jgi:hypothetical protein